jgi:superfamily II DNA/RNA helicase
MFSATMPPSIKTLSLTYLTDPKHISIGSTTQPIQKIKQETLQTSTSDKFSNLLKELNEREGSIIVFVKTKHSAERIAEKLIRQNHHASAIHGNLKQRQREAVLKDFRNLKKRIIIATDIAARGLDIPHIKHVINYDLPQCPEDYIHRIGRTGRAGMEGCAVSFISPEENQKWRRIHTLMHTGKDEAPSGSSGESRKKSKQRPFRSAEASKHGPSKHRFSKPGSSRFATSKPTTSEERSSKPEGSKHRLSKPGSSRFASSKPISSEERSSKPEGSKHRFSKPGSSRFAGSKPTPSEERSSKPEGSKHRFSKPGSSRFAGSKPTTSEERSSKPARFKPSDSKKSISKGSSSKRGSFQKGSSQRGAWA